MALRDDLIAGLHAADAAGDTDAAMHFADQLKRLPNPITDYSRQRAAEGMKPSGKQLMADRMLETLQGGALGFGDEFVGLIGGLDSLIRGKNSKSGQDTFQGGYDSTVQRARSDQQSYEKARPLEALGLQAAGMIPGIVLAAPAAGAKVASSAIPTVLSRAFQGAKAGAKLGAISGAGNANGDLSDRVEGAGVGALEGGALGSVLPVIPAGVKGATRLVKGAMQPSEDFARNAVARAFGQDAITTADARAQLAANPSKSLLDVGGPGTTALAEQGALEGKGRQTAEKYFADAAAQREGTALSTVKRVVNDKNLYDVVDDLNATRRSDAKPLYEAAYNAAYRRTPRLLDLIKDRPAIGQAYRAAISRMKNDPDVNPADVEEALGKVFGPVDDSVSDVQLTQRLTQALGSRPVEFKALDYIKRGLDAVASDPSASNEVRRLRTAFRDELKSVNPAYQKALNTYAGPSAVLDAVEQGRGFDKLDPEAISRMMSTMGESEQQGFQVGVARRLADLAQGTGGTAPGSQNALNLAKKISGQGVMQARLRAALGSTGADADTMLARNGWKPAGNGIYQNTTAPGRTITVGPDGTWQVDQLSKSGKSTTRVNMGHDQSTLESFLTGQPVTYKPGLSSVQDLIDMSNNFVNTAAKENKILGNSATARRLAGAETFDQAGIDPETAQAFAHAARGGWSGLIGHAAARYWNTITKGLTSERRAAVNQLLMSRNPADNARALELIDQFNNQAPPSLKYQPGIVSTGAAPLINSSQGNK